MDITISAIENVTEIEEGYLGGTISIMGVPHHVDLLAVTEDNGVQYASGPSEIVDNMFEALQRYDDGPGKFQTITLDGQHYVVVITPHAV